MGFIKEKAELIKKRFIVLRGSASSKYILLKEKLLFYKEKLLFYKEKLAVALPYAAYFPFIGWFFPMCYRKDDRFFMFHALQGFVLSVFFFSITTLLFFLTALVPADGGIIKFIIVMIIYFNYLVYTVLAAAGTKFLLKNIEKGIPFFEKIAQRIEI
jgi:uncharacterized membrane protein